MNVINLPGGVTVTLEQVQEAVKAGTLPVRHEQWKWSKSDKDLCCTGCGHVLGYNHEREYLFCPSCGAVMDKVMVEWYRRNESG